MQDINELKAKQARELADLKAMQDFAQLLPLAPSYVRASLVAGTPRATIKVEGIGGALEALKLFTIVPFTEYRDGCLNLKPIAFCKGIDADKHADQWAASLVAETTFISDLGPHTKVKLKFFARIPGALQANGVVHITLAIKGPDYIGMFNALGASCELSPGRKQVRQGTKRPNNALNGYCDRVISWASDDTTANYEYLICSDYADQDATGPKELSHLFGQLQNMSDEFDKGAK
jgi:hypothetical protein